MGWVRNVVLINVYLGLEKPHGVGTPGGGTRWAGEGNAGVSLRATQGRGGRILSQQGGFQVSGKRQQGKQGEQGEQGDNHVHNCLFYVYNRMIAAVNDTSCIYMHNNNHRNECC
jgi:hypothetical protein